MGLSMNQVKGFVLSCVIVIITFILSAIAAGLLADALGVWKKPFIGAFAAFLVVIAGYATAPSHKKIAATAWLLLGAVAAWILSGQSYYPEDHQLAYQLTFIPLTATYLSGLAALLLCLLWHKKYNNTLSR